MLIYMYFAQEGCGPCKVFKPKFEEICKQKGYEYRIYDAEKDEIMFGYYGVRSVPYIVIEDNTTGKIAARGMAGEMLDKI